jgi:hypothetical protein
MHHGEQMSHGDTSATGEPVLGRPPGDREVVLGGAFNVRDLGGLPVEGGSRTRRGLVYRADSLDSLTESDERLLFGTLAVGALLDLRTPEESGGDGLSDARRFPALRASSHPVIPDGRIGVEPFPAGDAEAVAKLYLEYVVDRGDIVAGAVAVVADSVGRGVPALFHCAAGRDRTGVVAAVILSLLGVGDAAIVDDYLESNRQAAEVSARLTLNPLYRDIGPDGSAAATGHGPTLVDGNSIRSFLELFRAEFETPRRWANAFGLTDELLFDFARVMTDAGPDA